LDSEDAGCFVFASGPTSQTLMAVLPEDFDTFGSLTATGFASVDSGRLNGNGTWRTSQQNCKGKLPTLTHK